MKNAILLLLITLSQFISATLAAQPAEGKTGALLWKISGNELAKPSYILGTHHLTPATVLDAIPGFKTAFAACEQVVGELDFSDMQGMEMRLNQAGMMPPDTAYQHLLSSEEFAILDNKLRDFFGAGIQQLGMLKPAMLGTMYSVMLTQKHYPLAMNDEAMDTYLQKQGKPAVGLESIEEQIHVLLGSQSLRRQAELLLCALNQHEKNVKQVESMHTCYHNADLDCLYSLLNNDSSDGECRSSQQESNALNKDRNKRWIKKLPALMQEKASLIAVGCLHLAGPEGLLAQLEQLGYTVEPVREELLAAVVQ